MFSLYLVVWVLDVCFVCWLVGLWVSVEHSVVCAALLWWLFGVLFGLLLVVCALLWVLVGMICVYGFALIVVVVLLRWFHAGSCVYIGV